MQFYPANSELLHAVGILFMGNDLLSPLINLGWMALTLLAAWCIGRPFGVAPVAVTAVALLLGTPGLVATQPGGGYTDVVGLALFLMSIAILVSTDGTGGIHQMAGIAIAALAAGLAFGTKFTLVGPVAALTVGCLRRVLPGAAASGAVAYGWDWWPSPADIGTCGIGWRSAIPLPSLSHLGPITLPSPPITSPNTTFGHYLFSARLWRRFFIPGLRSSFGPAWVAIVAAAALGLALVIFSRRNNLWKMVAAVGAVSVVVFIYTPQFLGLPGAPFYFVYNLRYVTPALSWAWYCCQWRLAGPGTGSALVGSRTAGCPGGDPARLDHLARSPVLRPVRPPDVGCRRGGRAGDRRGRAGRGTVAGLRLRRHAGPPAGRFGPAGPLIAVVALGYPLQQFYLSNRYVSTGAGSVVAPQTVAWAQALTHAGSLWAGAL